MFYFYLIFFLVKIKSSKNNLNNRNKLDALNFVREFNKMIHHKASLTATLSKNEFKKSENTILQRIS